MVGLSLGLGIGLSRRMAGEIGPTLSNLVLSASTVSESAASGTAIGTVIGQTKDSTLELTGDAGGLLALDGVTLETAGALDYETASSLAWEITETLAGATNSPRVSDGAVAVSNVLEVTLGALNLDDLTHANDATQGTKVGTITGGSSGSTITLLSQEVANAYQKDGGDIEIGSAGPLSAGYRTITLQETHPDASNSGRQSVVTITSAAPAGNLYPDPDLLEGDNWNATWDCSVAVGAVGPNGADAVGAFLLTTDVATYTTLQSVLDTSTAYNISFTIANFANDGADSCEVSLGGSFVNIGNIAGNGVIGPFVVTTPASAGSISLSIRNTDTGSADFDITHIEITE